MLGSENARSRSTKIQIRHHPILSFWQGVRELRSPNTNASQTKKVVICHVAIGDLWAGAEVQLAALLCNLAKRPEFKISSILFNENRLVTELRRAGIDVMVFPEAHWSATTIFTHLVRFFRHHETDIVHTHKYKDNILGAVAAKIAGVPHVVRTVHGLSEPFKGIESLRMRIYQLCDRGVTHLCVSKLIAVSSDIEKVLCLKYGAQRVIRIHNGVDLEGLDRGNARDEVRRELGVDSECLLIGTVGRLTTIKGHEYLLKTAQLVLQKRRDVKFVIVGDGPLRVGLQNLAAQLRITENVAFLGHQDDASSLMEAMDIFVLPSLHEGIPMAILEAMALGRPVVASRVGGIPEVITDGVHGLLVSAGDPAGIAQACLKLIGDRGFAERCGRAGRVRVAQQFSSDVMGGKIANLYRQLVGNGRSRQVLK